MPNDRHYSPRRTRDDDRERLKVYPARRDHDRGRSRSRSKSPPRSRRDGRSRSRSPRARRSRSRSITRRRRRSHSRSRSRSAERRDKRRRDRSPSSSSEDGKRKKKKDKERKRNRSKERNKEGKKKKKEKKDKKKLASSNSWGKYGTISEADIFTKDQEFYTWLVEERKINPETISKEQNKREFAQFVEDYNTATLPHEKYYNMAAFERHMTALKEGEFLPPDDSYDPLADMKALKSAHKRKAAEQDSFLNRDQLMELRKVQHERVEASRMKLLGMDVKQNMGVRMEEVEF